MFATLHFRLDLQQIWTLIKLVGYIYHHNTQALFTRAPSTGRSALHADRSVATLKAPERESPVLLVTCSTQRFRGWPGCLLQVPNCPGPVVTWQRDVVLGGQEQPGPYAWRGQRECLIASLMDGSCKRVALYSFVTGILTDIHLLFHSLPRLLLLECLFLVGIFRSSSHIKVIGSRSRQQHANYNNLSMRSFHVPTRWS